jgi:hypothetical protein
MVSINSYVKILVQLILDIVCVCTTTEIKACLPPKKIPASRQFCCFHICSNHSQNSRHLQVSLPFNSCTVCILYGWYLCRLGFGWTEHLLVPPSCAVFLTESWGTRSHFCNDINTAAKTSSTTWASCLGPVLNISSVLKVGEKVINQVMRS